MLARIRGNPRPLVAIAIAIALLMVFFVIVAPLFNTSGAATAELSGGMPAGGVVGHQLEIDLGLDNTGLSVISPICILVSVPGGLHPDYAIFQGVDRETVMGGKVCGGALNGQDSISIRMFVTPLAAGRASIALTPAKGGTAVGSAFTGTITVVAA
jgi:hypothetical protein